MNAMRVSLVLFSTAVICMAACGRGQKHGSSTTPSEEKAAPPNPLKVTVERADARAKFLAYVTPPDGSISPDDLERLGDSPMRGDGDSLPLISIVNNRTFLAGEVTAKDGKSKLIRVTFAVANPTPEARSFKLSDVTLVIGSYKSNEFVAAGYGHQLCGLFGKNRETLKDMVVDVAPRQSTRLSVAFPLPAEVANTGELMVGNSAPGLFEIRSDGSGQNHGQK